MDIGLAIACAMKNTFGSISTQIIAKAISARKACLIRMHLSILLCSKYAFPSVQEDISSYQNHPPRSPHSNVRPIYQADHCVQLQKLIWLDNFQRHWCCCRTSDRWHIKLQGQDWPNVYSWRRSPLGHVGSSYRSGRWARFESTLRQWSASW